MQILDPIRMYESRGEVCKVQTAILAGAVANNQQIVAAITGKRIRVMGWIAQSSTGVVGTFLLKSASGGTTIMPALAVPVITAGANDKLPIADCGYMETVAGEGLFTDIATAAINLTIFYITYIP